MKGRILILHESSIVAEGLAAIIHKYYDIDIQTLKSSGDFDVQRSSGEVRMIIASNELTDEVYGLLQRFKTKRQIPVIAVIDGSEEINNKLTFDHSFNIKTSEQNIQEICSKYLNIGSVETNNKEGILLSVREKDVLKLVASGLSNKQMTQKLFISVHTVISHRKHITEKTGIKSVSGLTIYAILNKLIDTEAYNIESGL